MSPIPALPANHSDLIHMNGRIYDPKLGRMLQADPFIQAPKNSQSLNRYAYVQNNPLSYTDPSGYSLSRLWKKIRPFVAIAIAIWLPQLTVLWQAIGISSSIAIGGITGFVAGYVGSGNLNGALAGAFAGTAFAALHQWNAAGKAVTFGKSLAHGAVGGVQNLIQGAKFGHGFFSAGFTQALASPIGNNPDRTARILAAATVGGTVSQVTGGKFANGAVTAAMAFSFGQLANETEEQRLEREGRPLTADEREIFADHFPEETLDSARIIDGRVPWWLRKDMAAITLGNRIHFREGVYVPGTASGAEILGHELVHVQQFSEGMTILRYLLESRRGYSNNRFEIEAYSRDTQIRGSFCQANPQAEGC